MRIAAVIAQLRQYAPIFGGRVAGAAKFHEGVKDAVWLDPPCAYVVPVDETAGENESMVGLWQTVGERVAVIVQFSTINDTGASDRRGQGAAEEFDDVKAALKSALLNWRPDPERSTKGFQYSGGELRDDFDRARLFYQWTFEIETTTTDDDGWQQPSVDLEEIDLSVTSQENPNQVLDVPVTNLQD